MHIPENYLSPLTCGIMAAAMVPVWVHAVKKVKTDLPKEKVPMLGVGAAFSFLSMMFNVPMPGGTTGHAVGGTLIALLFGPDAACIAVSVALLLQAVIFGDGGILSYGANCFNMAFVLPYVGYGMFLLLRKLTAETRSRYVAAAVGAYIGINAAAFCAAVEFGLQPLLFTDTAGNALYCPYDLSVSIPAMMVPHLLVAGVVEAAFTLAVYAFVRKTSPELLYGHAAESGHSLSGLPAADAPAAEPVSADKVKALNAEGTGNNGKHGKKQKAGRRPMPVFALLAVMIAAVPLGLLAAGTAWGEWGADEIAGVVTDGSALGYTPSGLAGGWSFEALMPDYALSGVNEVLAYILSAVIGTSLLIILFKLISIPLRRNERKRHAS